jgi:ABC-type branched-subunit amino acid transport system substrate-binding protein
MALTGDFKETSFVDLLQLYGISRQSVALTVYHRGPGTPPDGVFWFDRGDLVSARLDGAEGREAVRRALRLGSGRFTVDPDAALPAGAEVERDALKHVIMEEVVNVDEERHLAVTAERPLPPTPPRQAAPGGPPPPARTPSPPRGTAPPRPPGGGSGGSGGSGGTGGTGGGNGGGPRRPTRSERSNRPLVLGGLAVGLAVLGGLAWFVLARPPAPPPPPPAPVAAAPVATFRGVKPDEIVLGMAASFTGSNKERGRAMRAGWEAALAAANAAGGVNGRKLRLVAVDDAYDPQKTGPAMKQLVEGEQVFAVVGNVGTATAAVAIPYCAEQKVVFFGALSGGDGLRKSPPDRLVFNYRASLAEEAAAAVRWLTDVRRVAPEKIGVLVQKDEFGESGWRGAVKQLEAAGVPPAAVVRMEYARNTADVREALDKLREKGAAVQAVVLVATYKPAATFIRKARDAGHDLAFVSVSADSNGLAQELVEGGARYADGVVITQVVPVPGSKASGVLKYRKALEEFAPGEPPGSTTLEAWIGAQVFLEGLRRAGPALDTDKLVAALESIKDLDLGTGAVMSFGPADHQACDKVWGWALQGDGTFKQIDLE